MIWRLIVSVSIPLLIGAAGCLPIPAALPNHQSRLLGDAGVMVMAAREVPLAPSPADRTRRARLFEAAREQGVPLAAILTSVAVVVGVYLVGNLAYRLRDILLILLMAGFVAVVLNPLVVVLQRVGISRRGVAVAVVTVLAVLAFAGLAVAFGSPLITGVTHLSHGLPTYVAQAQHGKGWIGHLVRHYHIEAWVQKNAPKLASVGSSLARPALTLGRGAVTLMITLLTIFVLVVLFLLEGPKFRTAALRTMSPERAARYARVAGEVSRSVAGYVLGDLMTSLIAGTVVLLTLAVLGVPFAFLWGLWVALVDFLPEIGGALAGIPTVLFAATHSITAGIVTLVVFLVYTQFENHVLNPVIMSRTVKVNPCWCWYPSWSQPRSAAGSEEPSAASWQRCSPFPSPAQSR